MIIDFRVIPHQEQRYPTVGDYWEAAGTWHFRVSKMPDRRYEWLVFLHEVIEASLLALASAPPSAAVEAALMAPEAAAKAFDEGYEQARAAGTRALCGCKVREEPGNDRHAPYHRQHRVATACERLMARVLGVNWRAYSAEVDSL